MIELLELFVLFRIEGERMCEICGGDLVPMGCLGNMHYYRCRNCGMQHSSTEPLVSDAGDTENNEENAFEEVR